MKELASDILSPKALHTNAQALVWGRDSFPRILGVACSGALPGSLLLSVLDTAADLRDAGVTVMSGFHSKMEQEFLKTLLRGQQPIIICLARALNAKRIPTAWKQPLAEGRLLIISTQPDHIRRTTAATAQARNEYVAQTADALFVPYAAPGSKTEALVKKIAPTGKPIYTIIAPETTNLQGLGALCIQTFLNEATVQQREQ